MRLCSYVVKTDTGLAPNPFWGFCTLALCTPNHMGVELSAGDWIIGTTPKNRRQRLLYAMQVEERLRFDAYFADPRSAGFYSWGEKGIPMPGRFEPLIQSRQGCSCKHDERVVSDFVQWLSENFQSGIHGEPADREEAPCSGS